MKVSNKITSAFASNKYVLNDVVAKGGIITATDRMLKILKKISAFASEMGRSV